MLVVFFLIVSSRGDILRYSFILVLSLLTFPRIYLNIGISVTNILFACFLVVAEHYVTYSITGLAIILQYLLLIADILLLHDTPDNHATTKHKYQNLFHKYHIINIPQERQKNIAIWKLGHRRKKLSKFNY